MDGWYCRQCPCGTSIWCLRYSKVLCLVQKSRHLRTRRDITTQPRGFHTRRHLAAVTAGPARRCGNGSHRRAPPGRPSCVVSAARHRRCRSLRRRRDRTCPPAWSEGHRCGPRLRGGRRPRTRSALLEPWAQRGSDDAPRSSPPHNRESLQQHRNWPLCPWRPASASTPHSPRGRASCGC